MNTKLTKLGIIDRILKSSYTQSVRPTTVKKMVQAVFDMIMETLRAGGKVEIRNFGVFKIVHRKGRLGRNPMTKQEVMIPPRKVIKFVPGKVVKKNIQAVTAQQ